MPKKSTFSERLKQIITEKDIRQADLCEMTQIGKSAMSQYLSGSFQPKQRNLFKLAEALNVSEAWLMGYNVPKEGKRSVKVQLEDSISNEAVFCYTASDDSMINACIPACAKVHVTRTGTADHGQIVAYTTGSEVRLRRYICSDEHIFLMPENSKFSPEIFTQEELQSGRLKILGIAKRVIIDL